MGTPDHSARISVLRSKFAPGWPDHAEGERAYVLPLGEALERDYSSDAHCTAYETPNTNGRLG